MSAIPRAPLAVSLCLALVLAACGSSSGTQASAAPAVAAPVSSSSAAATGLPAATALSIRATPSPALVQTASPTTAAGAAASDAALDACALLTIDQASGLAGVTLTDTVKGGGTSGSACQYKGGGMFVTVSVKRLADAAAAGKALMQVESQIRADGGPGAISAVSGVGDTAFESRAEAAGVKQTGIVVASGADLVSILTNSSPADDSLRHCAEVAVEGLS
jgi:hypothetical protein